MTGPLALITIGRSSLDLYGVQVDARLGQPILADWKDGCGAVTSSPACVEAQETGKIVTISLPDRPALYK